MRLAIIIPTINEEAHLADLLPELASVADEIWISDGGSQDETTNLARALGAKVVTGEPGRGHQLNRGARASEAEVLLFLHAATHLPPEAREHIFNALQAGAIGGGFRVRFDDRRPLLRLGEALINLRTRLTGCPLGDQAQFATRATFEAMGGFEEWPILEDLDFARRLKQAGSTHLIQDPVQTAARRFLGQGIARTIATNWLIWALYFLRVSPKRLAKLYRHIR